MLTIKTAARNIRAVLGQAEPGELIHGQDWYATAREEALWLVREHDLPLGVVCHAIAALSPSVAWPVNLSGADTLIGHFKRGLLRESLTGVAGYRKNIDKAWEILRRHAAGDDTWRNVLSGPKVTAFAANIFSGGHLDEEITIDGHAWCIAHGKRVPLDRVPKISKALRERIRAAHRRVAEDTGLLPTQIQAITWVVWKRIHGV